MRAQIEIWNSLLVNIPKQRINMLTSLAENYSLSLLSNINDLHISKAQAHLKKDHQIENFEKDYFDACFYSCKIGYRKPEKEIYSLSSDIEAFVEDNVERSELQILNTDEYIQLKGTLKDIYAYIFKASASQVYISEKTNINYSIYIKNNLLNSINLASTLSKKLHLNLEEGTAEMEAIEFNLTKKDEKFWSVNQINCVVHPRW